MRLQPMGGVSDGDVEAEVMVRSDIPRVLLSVGDQRIEMTKTEAEYLADRIGDGVRELP